MSTIEEYKEYYAARVKKYEGNPKYTNTYLAEKSLFEAIDSSNSFDEFKQKMGNKNELVAIALSKDELLMEKELYEKYQETIRLKAINEILEKIDEFQSAYDFSSFATKILNQNNIEISMGESHRLFIDDWELIDRIEIYENAEVPDEYKADMKKIANETKQAIIENVIRNEENNNSWQNNWKIKPDIIKEYRHKRLLPYKDEDIAIQISKYKQITNR